ncbi:MAG TPA: hypothetical protein VFH02_14385 [Jiangellaceae bacterium]|nr:hypothetical protein [Jiangellaceae bacterium]
MNHVSRRTFIGRAAAGVAAATVVGVPALAAATSQPPDDDGDAPDLAGPVVARVRDVRTGELTLYVGTDEITYTDRSLARRLVRAAAL